MAAAPRTARRPALLAGALAAERRRLAVRAAGRTLDAGDATTGVPVGGLAAQVVATASQDVDGTGGVAGADGEGGALGADCVVGVDVLAQSADPDAEARRLYGSLRPGGRLLLVEPSARPGWRGLLGRVMSPAAQRRYGPRGDRLPVDTVRHAGFVLASTERITMPTLVAPLRWYVRIEAIRPRDTPGAEA
jgi:hypothetical protein